MVEPHAVIKAQIHLGAEGTVILLVLGARVDQRALLARERPGVEVAFEQVLADFRPDSLEQPAQMADQGVISQDGMRRLHNVLEPNRAGRRKEEQWPQKMRARHGAKHRKNEC